MTAATCTPNRYGGAKCEGKDRVAAIHHEPVTLVTVTVTGKGAVWPPVMVNEQVPAETPVTVNGPVPDVGETVAMPLHVGVPFVTVNEPE